MAHRFANEETRLIFEGFRTKATRRVLPDRLLSHACNRIDFVLQAEHPYDCKAFAGFKMLQGKLHGTYQFRLGGPYRLRFRWKNGQATQIAVGEFHDEDKR